MYSWQGKKNVFFSVGKVSRNEDFGIREPSPLQRPERIEGFWDCSDQHFLQGLPLPLPRVHCSGHKEGAHTVAYKGAHECPLHDLSSVGWGRQTLVRSQSALRKQKVQLGRCSMSMAFYFTLTLQQLNLLSHLSTA